MLNKINITPQKQKLIVYFVLIAATLAVFWQATQFDFINLDDDVYVTANSHIKSGITVEAFRWAFSSIYAEFWHPLTWLSLMLDYQFYGLNAGGYHITNIILHILSTLLLFWLFNHMTGAVWKSAFVAALFALHPLRLESVIWIAKRKDVLSVFFWMLTLCLYVYYTKKPVIRRYLLVLFSFACGLMSKPIVVTLPIVMMLLDHWPLGRFQSQKGNWILWQLKEKIPFFVLSAIFSIITLHAQFEPWAKYLPLQSRLINASVAFVTYLENIFWPYNLAVLYPFSDQIPIWQVIGSILLIIVISIAVIVTMKRFSYFFVGWFWYAITILPVIGISQSGPYYPHLIKDHYTYLPSIGISIMLAWGIPLLFPRENIRKRIIFPAGIAVLTIMAVITWQQCVYWKNSTELFSHALQVKNDNFLAHTAFGNTLVKEGKIGEAIKQYDKAIRIKPTFPYAYNNRGIAYIRIGQYQKAFDDFNEAINLKKYYVNAYMNRGILYGELSQHHLAIEDLNKAISIKPDYAPLYINRGNNYIDLGQYNLAIADYNEAILLKPDDHILYNNRGSAYLKQDNKELGCRDAQKACALENCKLLEWAKDKGLCH